MLRHGTEPTIARAPAIADCAVIGDGRSAALVSKTGAIEWLCWPRFDAASLFASILDPDKGGTFRVRPRGVAHVTRRYLPETNVLETTFATRTGTLVLTDFMPIWCTEPPARQVPESELLRRATCTEGEVVLEVLYAPRPCYGACPPKLKERKKLGWALDTHHGIVYLRTHVPLIARGGVLVGEKHLSAGESADFSLTCSLEPAVLPPLGERTTDVLHRTVRAWHAWSRRTKYDGPFRDAVVRSALALKLLAFSPTGAIVAAPTTSLPEWPGGTRNWDYRYCWLRDASLTARALFGLGHHDEAHAFLGWTLHATRLTRPRLEVLYDLYGRRPIPEHTLPHLEGWRGSKPVRVGNAADRQCQLDVYGEVIDAAAWLARHGGGFDRATAKMLTDFGRFVRAHWSDPDHGIWEPRNGRRQHTHSRVLAWTALDRLVALHDAGLLQLDDRAGYMVTRDTVRTDIERRGFDKELGTYTRTIGGKNLDAALLLMPHYGYLPGSAPRMRATVAAIRHGLGAGGPLLRRCEDEDEGAFGICSFWLAECLALGAGTVEEAETVIRGMLDYANDVGLFGEEVDAVTGEALGNFQQGFTHIGLINAAMTVELAREAMPVRTLHRARCSLPSELPAEALS